MIFSKIKKQTTLAVISAALLLPTIFFTACGGASKKDFEADLEHCPQKPTAIFQSSMNGIKAAKFTLEKTKSIENVTFADGSNLELIQMGCAHISQEFRFEINDFSAKNEASEVAEMAAEKFSYIAKLDSKLAGLSNWAAMLREVKSGLKIGEATELEPHHFLKIDFLPQDKNALLIVTIFDK